MAKLKKKGKKGKETQEKWKIANNGRKESQKKRREEKENESELLE